MSLRGILTVANHPTDNQLLSDCVRVLARWLGRLSCFVDFPYRDHGLRARRRCLAISNARRQTLRIGPYRDLLKVTRKMAGYARAALAERVNNFETLW